MGPSGKWAGSSGEWAGSSGEWVVLSYEGAWSSGEGAGSSGEGAGSFDGRKGFSDGGMEYCVRSAASEESVGSDGPGSAGVGVGLDRNFSGGAWFPLHMTTVW